MEILQQLYLAFLRAIIIPIANWLGVDLTIGPDEVIVLYGVPASIDE